MSIENITQKIIQEAEAAAKQVLTEAEGKSQAIVSEAEAEADGIIKAASSKAAQDAEVVKSRKIAVAELESRKMMLGAKQDAVKKGFDNALRKVANMPENEYISFLAGMIKDLDADGGEIVLNSMDKERIGNKLIETVCKGEHAGKFSLGGRTLRSEGGFILQNKDVELNCTIETIINSVKEELTLKVVEALFK